MSQIGDDILDGLVAAARDARERFYAPYSGFAVGAAILAGGTTFVGANIENASYPLSVCAERNAVGAMIIGGQRHIDAVAVVAGGDGPASPCGRAPAMISSSVAGNGSGFCPHCTPACVPVPPRSVKPSRGRIDCGPVIPGPGSRPEPACAPRDEK